MMQQNTIRNKIHKLVYEEVKPKYEQGFTDSEIFRIIKLLGGKLNIDKYNDAMMGNTSMLIDNKIVNYHCDVITALLCAYEDRNITINEFD